MGKARVDNVSSLLLRAILQVLRRCQKFRSCFFCEGCCRRGVMSGRIASSSSGPHLNELPPDALDSIFSHYRRGHVKDIARSAAVARTLYITCKPLLQRYYGCRKCNTPIYHARVVLKRSTTPLHYALEDGPAVVIADMPLIRDGESTASTTASSASSQEDLHLKNMLMSVAKQSSRSAYKQPSSNLDLKWLSCPRCFLYLGECLTPSDAKLDNNAISSVVCSSYIHEVDLDGPCEEGAVPIFCSGARRLRGKGSCGQLLCNHGDVLSEQHCWAPPGGMTESAWYINGFKEGSVVVAKPERKRLAQGAMEVADVSCALCLGVVGWKFVKDLSVAQRNRNQVGRFGLCTSSIRQEHDTSKPAEDPERLDGMFDEAFAEQRENAAIAFLGSPHLSSEDQSSSDNDSMSLGSMDV